MHSLESARLRKLGGLVFVVCVACTLWLMVQNTILLTLVSWDHVHGAIAVAPPVLRVAVTWIVQLALIPIAFALGWLVSRWAAGAGNREERAHE